jgi:hypothetical protein
MHFLHYFLLRISIPVSILSKLGILLNKSQNYANNMFKQVTVCTKNAVNLHMAATSCRLIGKLIWSIKQRNVNISGKISTACTGIVAIISTKIPTQPESNSKILMIFLWMLSGKTLKHHPGYSRCWIRLVSSDNMSLCKWGTILNNFVCFSVVIKVK